MEKHTIGKIQSVFIDRLSRFRTDYMSLYGMALWLVFVSVRLALHANRSYGYALRSRAAPTNTNPQRRTGRTNAAKPMDGRERPDSAMPKGHSLVKYIDGLVRNAG